MFSVNWKSQNGVYCPLKYYIGFWSVTVKKYIIGTEILIVWLQKIFMIVIIKFYLSALR